MKMSPDSPHILMVVFGMILLAVAVSTEEPGLQENLKDLVSNRKCLEFMRQVVEDMDSQLRRRHKLFCLLHFPGMDCNLGDTPVDVKHLAIVGDDLADKKRRHSNCGNWIGNPEGCLGKDIDDQSKDNAHWGDLDGPGRK